MNWVITKSYNPKAPALPTAPAEVSAVPTPTPTPTPTTTPTPEVTELKICYNNDQRTEFAARVGDKVKLTGTHYPLTIPADYSWSIADESIASIKVDENGACTVTGVSPGTTTLKLTCYGKTVTCTVYVRN